MTGNDCGRSEITTLYYRCETMWDQKSKTVLYAVEGHYAFCMIEEIIGEIILLKYVDFFANRGLPLFYPEGGR